MKGKGVYDAIILDAGGVDNSEGISFPHPSFLDKDFLEASKEILAPDGMLIMNLLARSKERYQGALKSLAHVFPLIKAVGIDEDVNLVVFAFPNEPSVSDDHGEEGIKAYIQSEWDSDSFTIEETLEGLHVVKL